MPPHIEGIEKKKGKNRIEKKKVRTGVERQFRGHFSKAEKLALVIACTWPNLISLFIFKQQKKISRDMASHSPECPHSLVFLAFIIPNAKNTGLLPLSLISLKFFLTFLQNSEQ